MISVLERSSRTKDGPHLHQNLMLYRSLVTLSLAYDIHDEAGSKGEPLVVGDWFVMSVSHLHFVMSVLHLNFVVSVSHLNYS